MGPARVRGSEVPRDMVTGGQRQGGYGSHAVGVRPQGQQPAESILGTLVGRLLAPPPLPPWIFWSVLG